MTYPTSRPPQHPPSPYYGPPVAALKNHTVAWVLGIGGAVLVVVIAAVVGLIFIGSQASSVTKSSDVKITACEASGDYGSTVGDATLSIVNTGSNSASYFVTVAFTSDDHRTQYDTAYATVNALAPGQSTTADAIGLRVVPQEVSCGIVKVSRI